MRHFLHNHQHKHIFLTFNQYHCGQVVTDMYSSKPVGEWRSTLASLDLPRYEVSPSDAGDDHDDTCDDPHDAGDTCDDAGDNCDEPHWICPGMR